MPAAEGGKNLFFNLKSNKLIEKFKPPIIQYARESMFENVLTRWETVESQSGFGNGDASGYVVVFGSGFGVKRRSARVERKAVCTDSEETLGLAAGYT